MAQLAAVAVPARAPSAGFAGVPGWLELLVLVAVIASLLPAFERVAEFGAGRDRRFAEGGFRIDGLPSPVLPLLCRDAAVLAAGPSLRDRLCDGATKPTTATATPSIDAGPTPSGAKTSNLLPAPLGNALSRSIHAFSAPLDVVAQRLDTLRQGQHDGGEALRQVADAMAALEADVEPYRERFQLGYAGVAGPLPLACAADWADATLLSPAATGGAAATAQGNGLLLLAAALDGRGDVEALADAAALPAASPAPPCEAGTTAMLVATASLMADARQSFVNWRKNAAMRALLQTAGWQWAGALGLGYLLLRLSRRKIEPALGVAASLALWAGAAWFVRVPWPFAGHRGFDPGRVDADFASRPASYVLVLLAAALVAGIVGLVVRRAPAPDATAASQSMSSRIGYSGLALATGAGWLILLDLSANAHRGNRYLALYHQGHLWLGLTLFSTLLFLRQPLGRGLAFALSTIGEAARGVGRRLGSAGSALAVVSLALAMVLAFGLVFANLRQFTSEVGRVWLIVGAAWFFFLRAGPLAERLARAGPAGTALWRYSWPLLLVVGVLIATMLLTRDMGPLLIAGYASGAFLAAAVARWWQLRSGQRGIAYAVAVLLFVLWIGSVTVALFTLGSVDGVAAERLESLAAPFASANDQLALVTWFQRAAPAQGFGLGAAPWCGYATGGACGGVPAQIHSDYTFSAIVGVFGPAAAWAAAVGCAFWLHRLIRHHGRVTRGEPRLVAREGTLALDGQALLSWIAVAWVVHACCQLAVTVAGNLAVLPLTGVTFPFVSFGMTSLLVNLAFLALAIQIDVPARARDG